MFMLILRGLIAGFIIIGVSEIAGKFPRLSALILTVPALPAAILLLTYLKGYGVGPVSTLSREMLFLIALGLPIFVPLAFAHKLQLSFWPAFLAGIVLSSICITTYVCLAPRNT